MLLNVCNCSRKLSIKKLPVLHESILCVYFVHKANAVSRITPHQGNI